MKKCETNTIATDFHILIIVDCFSVVSPCAQQCVSALTIFTLEMRDTMVKLLPEVLLDLSKISATVYIAVPILEFLSSEYESAFRKLSLQA